jgi:organic hydroperoxide reductase OsmC/OhrA
MSTTHAYQARLTWRGSTAAGYEQYIRAHRVEVPPAHEPLALSSDPSFHGDGTLANPEQLLLAAASSCQLLSFLALAARARVEVLAYDDDAHAVMPEDDPPMRITEIVLRPRIVVAAGTPVEKVRRLVDLGHEQCFIANTLNAAMKLEPVIEVAAK